MRRVGHLLCRPRVEWVDTMMRTEDRHARDASSERLESFERDRKHLLAVAFRLLGSEADAQDVIQEARLDRAPARHAGCDGSRREPLRPVYSGGGAIPATSRSRIADPRN